MRDPLRPLWPPDAPLPSQEARALPQRFEHRVRATQQTSSSVRYGWTGSWSTCSQSVSLKGSAPFRSPKQANAPLKMERLWIIDGARNPPDAQVQLHPVALHSVGQADGVLRPGRLGLRG